MQVSINDVVVATATEDEVVSIEGNYYFPPSSIDAALFTTSSTAYTCPWKGAAQYWDVTTPGGAHKDAAWSYPDLYDGATKRVGRDFAGYLAFDRSQVTVS
ncbi:DUF427 domain-containing protein [Dermatophilaceae bacterium Sec6.4]